MHYITCGAGLTHSLQARYAKRARLKKSKMDPSGIQNQERRGPSSDAEPYVVNLENDPFSALAFKVIHERGRGPLVVSLTSLNWIRCVVNVLSGIYI